MLNKASQFVILILIKMYIAKIHNFGPCFARHVTSINKVIETHICKVCGGVYIASTKPKIIHL